MLKPSRAKRLSDLLPEAIGPVAARQGFAGGEIVSRWAAIVGPEIAAVSAPVKLAAQRPKASDADPAAAPERATLTLRVEGAFALEIQHRAPEILERVNAHLGWPCVGQIRLKQGAIAGLRREAERRPPAPEATPGERAVAAQAARTIEDPGLAEAIERLGQAALARARRRSP